MSGRPALVRQGDLQRIIRAIVREGATATIRIEAGAIAAIEVNGAPAPAEPVAPEKDLVF